MRSWPNQKPFRAWERLEKGLKVNIETNHKAMDGLAFGVELGMASTLGILGLDYADSGGARNSWDTGQLLNLIEG